MLCISTPTDVDRLHRHARHARAGGHAAADGFGAFHRHAALAPNAEAIAVLDQHAGVWPAEGAVSYQVPFSAIREYNMISSMWSVAEHCGDRGAGPA